MIYTIKIKRGIENSIPLLLEGELAFTTDTKNLFIGSNNGNIKFSNTTTVIDNSKITYITLTTTTNNTNQVIDSFNTSLYRTAKYIVQVTSGTSHQSVEIMLIHNGTNVFLSEYGKILTDSNLATFDADINNGYVRLLINPINTNNFIKIIRTIIDI